MGGNSNDINNLTSSFDDANLSMDNGNEWFIAINTLPVKREAIVDGFFDQMGLDTQNNVLLNILKSILPMFGKGIFDQVANTFFGGGANHNYISVCEVVDGKPVVREVLHSMGLEYDEAGKPILSSAGNLTPVVVDENSFANDPLYSEWTTKTTQTQRVLQGSKDEIYQGYVTMLDTTEQIFKDPVKYGISGPNCNAAAAEALAAIDKNKEEYKALGAGFTADTFNTVAHKTTLTGADLMAEAELRKERLQGVFIKPDAPVVSENLDKVVINPVVNQ